jgi:superfamily I DNA/RNA helicase
MSLSGKPIAELRELLKHRSTTVAAVLEELELRKARREAKGQQERGASRSFRVELLRQVNTGNGARSTGARGTEPSPTGNVTRYWISYRDATGSFVTPTQMTAVEVKELQATYQEILCHDGQSWKPLSPPVNAPKPIVKSNLGFNATDEQIKAVELFGKHQHLKVFAFAGAGKTSTLKLLAHSCKRSGVYLAFNKSIVCEAQQKFPPHVDCRTVHSIAMKTVRSWGQFRSVAKLTGTLNPRLILEHVDIESIDVGAHKLSPELVAGLSRATIRKYAHGRFERIEEVAVPTFGVLANLSRDPEAYLAFCEQIHQVANKLWSKMINPRSQLPLGHDGYLKLWALSKPRLNADFILLDEAQDTNDVVLEVLQSQSSQVVYVGDRHQQIYEWRGAINALEQIQTKYECHLTKSFRFGPIIAHVANKVLRRLGETAKIKGNEHVTSSLSTIANPSAVIARTNAAVLAAVVGFFEQQQKVYVEGGVDDLKRLMRGVYQLRDNGASDVPEFFGFGSWDEVVEYSETEFGQELATFVSLVQSIGLGRLWHILKQVEPTAETAQVTVSTVHKAKGREWDTVRLCDDFTTDETDEKGQPVPIAAEDLRVLYVALTRAKDVLEIGPKTVSFLAQL